VSRLPLIPLLLATVLAMPACSRKAAPPTHAAAPVAAPGLGLEIGKVPDGFRLVSKSAKDIVLAPKGKTASGRVVISLLPAAAGLNLVEAVHRHQAAVSARPDGAYLGAQELTGPLGTAYWSRGRFTADGKPVEETVIFTLDPSGRRIVSIRYTYPAGGDSRERVRSLLDVLGEIEAIPPAGATPTG